MEYSKSSFICIEETVYNVFCKVHAKGQISVRGIVLKRTRVLFEEPPMEREVYTKRPICNRKQVK